MKDIRLNNKYLVPCLYVLILGTSACSNEGEESSDLQASAGEDRNVLVGQQVSLNGNGSGDSQGNVFDFSWEFLLQPASSNAELENSTTATPNIYS